MYSSNFNDFVNNGVSNNFFIGTGNPNAKILIIGKESAIDANDTESLKWYNSNAKDWKEDNDISRLLEYTVDIEHPLRKSWGKNTWSKYQKLSDFILKKEPVNFKIDFLKHIFTTELNDAPSTTTAKANKKKLSIRKQLFKDSKFIQDFPIVILACSNYIINDKNTREIDDIFDVKYSGNNKYYSTGNWYYLHYNQAKTKLVIHTRQLSSNVNNELLQDLGEIIRNFLLEI